MATANITVTITTPQNVTIDEALRLFTDFHKWDMTKGISRVNFAKTKIAEMVQRVIRTQDLIEKRKAVIATDIIVQ